MLQNVAVALNMPKQSNSQKKYPIFSYALTFDQKEPMNGQVVSIKGLECHRI